MKAGHGEQKLEVNLRKTKVMASVRITKDCLPKSIVYPCWICGLSAKAISAKYVQPGKWI